MHQNELEHVVLDVSTPRRTFLRNSLLLAVPVVLGGTAFSAAAAAFVPPTRTRGGTRISVRDKGARGNGTTDDTAAFQRAINALPSTGGTVYVPAGTYLIDAERSVRLRNRMHLQLASDAKLVAKPTSNGTYNVLLADNIKDVEISGGQIVGERDNHKGTGGESGHGIRIRGSERVTIRDIRASKCWGDGICVGPKPVYRAPYILSKDVVIANVVCTGNRRQGLSIGNVFGVKVYDSEFSDTHGTSPQCGIDVEPSGGVGYADNVRIENCLIRGNAAYGILMYERARNVTVTKCTIELNKSCGVVARGAMDIQIVGNNIRNNRSTGAFIQQGTMDCAVRENTFQSNYTKGGVESRADFTAVGIVSGIRKDLLLGSGTRDVQIGRNYYK